MDEVVVNAVKRDVIGKHVKVMRREGKIPGIIYGRGIEPTPIIMDLKETSRSLTGLGSSVLVTVVVDGTRHMTLVREKQRDFIRGTLKHVDFQAVSAKEKIRVNVAIMLQGEAPAVEDMNAILVTSMEQIEVECFPQDLIDHISVDITSLKSVGDAIHVRDLQIPEALHVLEDPNEIVVVATAQAAEEVEAAPVEVVAEGEPEVIEKGKKEEEEEE
jgi:large subunit ribosomal protein L25